MRSFRFLFTIMYVLYRQLEYMRNRRIRCLVDKNCCLQWILRKQFTFNVHDTYMSAPSSSPSHFVPCMIINTPYGVYILLISCRATASLYIEFYSEHAAHTTFMFVIVWLNYGRSQSLRTCPLKYKCLIRRVCACGRFDCDFLCLMNGIRLLNCCIVDSLNMETNEIEIEQKRHGRRMNTCQFYRLCNSNNNKKHISQMHTTHSRCSASLQNESKRKWWICAEMYRYK